MLCKSAQERIVHTLLDLADDYGIHDDRGILIPLRLDLADFGNLVGLARETSKIMLQDFKQRSLVEAGRRNIRITDPARLRLVSWHSAASQSSESCKFSQYRPRKLE